MLRDRSAEIIAEEAISYRKSHRSFKTSHLTELMLYLFDLDNTLLRTHDLSDVRESGVGNNSDEYISSLKSRLGDVCGRLIWSHSQLCRLLEKSHLSQDTKNYLGVFTRAPRSYAETILTTCYPDLRWDIVISYEDVAPKFKPHGYGIGLARERLKSNEIMVIGDNAADIKAAYHAVCWTAWDQTKQNGKFDFQAYDLLPDFTYSDVDAFLTAMDDPISHLMALEVDEPHRAKAMASVKGNGRTIVVFCPERRAHHVTVFGRYFSKYPPLKAIRARHNLSREIEACKNAESFPWMWLAILIHACREQLKYFGRRRQQGRVVLTCIPPRPTRQHRLGKLIVQCEEAYRPLFGSDRVIFNPDVFRFKEGVRSNHNDYLGKQERFENIASHLELAPSSCLHEEDTVIVVDDVVTTGSTLIGAQRLLEARGVTMIKLIGMTRNIGNIMPEKWANEALYDTDQ